jgi:hypothetical protein
LAYQLAEGCGLRGRNLAGGGSWRYYLIALTCCVGRIIGRITIDAIEEQKVEKAISLSPTENVSRSVMFGDRFSLINIDHRQTGRKPGGQRLFKPVPGLNAFVVALSFSHRMNS